MTMLRTDCKTSLLLHDILATEQALMISPATNPCLTAIEVLYASQCKLPTRDAVRSSSAVVPIRTQQTDVSPDIVVPLQGGRHRDYLAITTGGLCYEEY